MTTDYKVTELFCIIGKRIRDACIYPYKINVAQYYP